MKNFQKGQSLFEVIAALAVAVIIILALVKASTISIKNTSFSRNQSLATRYAQESIEEARKIRDENFADFFVNGYCDKSAETVGIFTRVRTCVLSADTMTVTATVSWQEKGQTYESKLETKLTNWK